MARWVTEEVGVENLPFDLIKGIDDRSALEVTMLCEAIQANEHIATHRDWDGVGQVLQKYSTDLPEVAILVKSRPAMHDKFWRYIELFAEVCKA